MQTVTWAVNRPVGVPTKVSDHRGWFPDCVVSNSAYFAKMRIPPALLSGAVISDWFLRVNL
jgi:hypothetical protein